MKWKKNNLRTKLGENHWIIWIKPKHNDNLIVSSSTSLQLVKLQIKWNLNSRKIEENTQCGGIKLKDFLTCHACMM